MKRGFRVALAVIAPAIAGCQATGGDVEHFVVKAGFVYNNPPTTLYGPGALVFRRNYDPKQAKFTSVQLGALCEPRFYLDKYEVRPSESPTLDTDLKNKIGGSFKVGFDALSALLGVQLSPEAMREAQISVKHARVLAYSDEALGDIRDLITPKCAGIVNKNIGLGNAYQVDRVLEASIDYTLTFNVKATASANLNVISRKVDGTIQLVDDNTAKITGNALYYGIGLRPVSEPLSPRNPAPLVAGLTR
jgi:hypothetical protein